MLIIELRNTPNPTAMSAPASITIIIITVLLLACLVLLSDFIFASSNLTLIILAIASCSSFEAMPGVPVSLISAIPSAISPFVASSLTLATCWLKVVFFLSRSLYIPLILADNIVLLKDSKSLAISACL